MSLPNAARIARRELRGGLRAFWVFLACLALGVAAIAAVGTVREGIEGGLDREGAALLGGDAELSFTYRFADADEIGWMLERAGALSEVVDFRSMAVTGEGEAARRALTQVKGVDDAYPLYGEVRLQGGQPLGDALAGRGARPGAVMAPVLAARLGLETGDTFRLGTGKFVLAGLIEAEPDDAGDGFGLGPRTLVRRIDLQGTGLLEPGTLFDSKYRMTLPPETDLEALEAAARARFADEGLRWRDRRNGAPGIAEFVEQMSAFLVLVGLAGLAVGGIGVSSAVNAYLDRKTEVIATLKSLGADGRTIFLAYFMQIGALALIGIGLGLAIGAAAPLLAAPLLEDRLPIPADFGLYPAPLAEAALYGALAAALFTLWPLSRAEAVRPAALFRGSVERRSLPRARYLVATLAVAAALVGSAAILSPEPILALYAALGVTGSLALLALAAAGTRILARRLTRSRLLRGRTALRLAAGSVGGPGGETAAVILSLGLGLSVLSAVGQVDHNLRSAIETELPDVAPAFFVLDIQPSQIDGYLERVEGDPGVSRVDTAPMLRGVISQINGRPAREVADHWVLSGDRGVTYSEAPPARTTLTAGTWWPEDYDGPPQVSFAAEEGAEMGLALGDAITVNILGREITAEITSFREVDFSSAGIGFIMSMNPAALEGFPHSWISTVYAEQGAEAALLRDISDAYPNITAIGVRDAIARVSEVLGSVVAAITAGAGATLLTGIVVLIGAAAAGVRARIFEAAVLRTVGAVRGQVLTYLALRSALLGAAAGLVALLAGTISAWAVMTFVLDADFSIAAGPALAIVLGGALASLLAGLAFAWRPLSVRPAGVLRARE
ncbi:ABC transporter permease [Tropicimonas sp. IMCC34011]|uniref:ABC transporter permease n=1 Tax=Tropicimonas sp. IMCC34011 TaxID=2248759 RepID=UPI000E23D980|nr:FtsX-like permease family protein [Tropicimonas sp. IMCC34011]